MRLFTAFHLNIAFSSIEESRRPDVVARCYWPLLRLIEGSALRAGIEATAYTLEVVNGIDSTWTAKLRELIADGRVELIGSGYAQLIGPLVPAEVNAANLRIGNRRYESLMGVRPRVALVNEQAYSSGLVAHYLEAGYDGLIMEWNNAARAHPEWPRSVRLAPSIAADQHGRGIGLLWNDSVAFQKFQRYVHGEMELSDELEYIDSQVTPDAQAFCLYGNDIEVFDFRPGRFHTEAVIEAGEWERIQRLVEALALDSRFSFALPSEVLRDCRSDGVARQLESATAPVLVKKQPKYNLTRWAVTGRDDIGINSACWRIYEQLMADAPAGDDRWRELCYLWSSDFRTHITTSRWTLFLHRLEAAKARPIGGDCSWTGRPLAQGDPRVVRERRQLIVHAPDVDAVVNLRRGLALDEVIFPAACPTPVAGTIMHGTLDDIALSADWYTGNLVLEAPGAHKVTDLETAQNVEIMEGEGGAILVTGVIPTRLGPIRKSLRFGTPAGTIEVRYRLEWHTLPRGSLRLGFVTLMPDAFDADSLMFRTHNGGPQLETFPLANTVVEHGAPVSFLVSSSHAVGITAGVFELGDARRWIRVAIEKGTAALVGMVSHRRVGDSYFCQVQFSAMELDDTSVSSGDDPRPPREIVLRYSGHQHAGGR
jgi:hypothetical protein